MRTGLVVIGVLFAGTAVGKPLPGGMKVVIKEGRPYVQQGQVTVPLRDDDAADYEKATKGELDADGKTVVVTATRCKGALTDDVTRVPLTKVQARLDAAAALAALGRKRYADAVTKLTAATQKDPETWQYATSLLAAQLLAKKTDAAGQTLAGGIRRNPVWFAWRLGVEAELAAARTHKRAKDLDAGTPGTATVGTLGDHDIATTQGGGGIVAMRTASVGSPGTSEVDFVGLASGKRLARMPLVAREDACDNTTAHPCDDAAKARIAERIKAVDDVLSRLGFTVQSRALVDARNGEPMQKDGVSVDTSDDALTATRGGNEASMPIDGNVWSIAITPKAVVAKVNRRNLFGCADGSSRLEAIVLPLP
jgi:hypothetical protein